MGAIRKVTRLAAGLCLICVPIIAGARPSQARIVRKPPFRAVIIAVKCVPNDGYDRIPKPELARVWRHLSPPDIARAKRLQLTFRPPPASALCANPAELPRVARKIAPRGSEDVPLC